MFIFKMNICLFINYLLSERMNGLLKFIFFKNRMYFFFGVYGICIIIDYILSYREGDNNLYKV